MEHRLKNGLITCNCYVDTKPFKRQCLKMVKHTQTIRRQFGEELFECLTILLGCDCFCVQEDDLSQVFQFQFQIIDFLKILTIWMLPLPATKYWHWCFLSCEWVLRWKIIFQMLRQI